MACNKSDPSLHNARLSRRMNVLVVSGDTLPHLNRQSLRFNVNRSPLLPYFCRSPVSALTRLFPVLGWLPHTPV